jgi:beta-lactamase regulating signal transducer with metallopeptidase domain
MNMPSFLQLWTTLAPALGDHLWQSTVFTIAAGILVLLLRKNRARARYLLWLIASLKFLVPFALLVFLGRHLSWIRSPIETQNHVSSAIREVGQSLMEPVWVASPGSMAETSSQPFPGLVPVLMLAIWVCGFVTVLSVWYVRWQKASTVVREGVLLHAGRELETLAGWSCRGEYASKSRS